MSDIYSPHTGEHIKTDSPSGWMGRAGVPAPEYNPQTHGCFWRGEAWELVPAPAAGESQEQARERAKAELQPQRDLFLNRLAGIAVFSDDPAVVDECAALRAQLLDITKDPAYLAAETFDDMEAALLARYRAIAAGASEAIRNVFRELDA